MKTDKQLFKIFEAVPEWLFELTGLPSPGSSTLQSFTVKALERAADGLVVPEAGRSAANGCGIPVPEGQHEMILIGELPDLEDTASGKPFLTASA